MRDAVIVEAVRTPVGKRNGGLSESQPADLSAHVLKAVAERSGVDPAVIEDVIWGCVGQVGDQAGNIGRYAVLAAGWPEAFPAPRSTVPAGPASRPWSSPSRESCPARMRSWSPAASR